MNREQRRAEVKRLKKKREKRAIFEEKLRRQARRKAMRMGEHCQIYGCPK